MVGKSPGERLLGRLRRSSNDNIKTNVREVCCEGCKWTELAQYRAQWPHFISVIITASAAGTRVMMMIR
jgi:hypothetical protein